jgi:hypothetical protein
LSRSLPALTNFYNTCPSFIMRGIGGQGPSWNRPTPNSRRPSGRPRTSCRQSSPNSATRPLAKCRVLHRPDVTGDRLPPAEAAEEAAPSKPNAAHARFRRRPGSIDSSCKRPFDRVMFFSVNPTEQSVRNGLAAGGGSQLRTRLWNKLMSAARCPGVPRGL